MRTILRTDLGHFTKKKIEDALSRHDTESLGLDFPFNLTTYKRLMKYGECKIIYCSDNMLARDLYIYRKNSDGQNLVYNKNKPCAKYK